MGRSLLQFVLLVALTSSVHAGEVKDAAFTAFARNRTNLVSGGVVRVTSQPIRMYERVAMLCNLSTADQKMLENTNSNPHITKYAHVYVSTEGVAAMRSYTNAFPKGTIILKEKFSDSDGKNTELFTGMIKRDSGYNPKCGDWEFFTLTADGEQVTSRGKIQGCMGCHIEYKESDYVTWHYRNDLRKNSQ